MNSFSTFVVDLPDTLIHKEKQHLTKNSIALACCVYILCTVCWFFSYFYVLVKYMHGILQILVNALLQIAIFTERKHFLNCLPDIPNQVP